MLQSDRHAPERTLYGSRPCSIAPMTETIVTRIYIRIMEYVSHAMRIKFQMISIIVSWNGKILFVGE